MSAGKFGKYKAEEKSITERNEGLARKNEVKLE